MKSYQKYLDEKLMDKHYGDNWEQKDIKRGMYVKPQDVEDTLIALYNKLTGKVPTDEEIEPFWSFAIHGDDRSKLKIAKYLSSKEPPKLSVAAA